MSAKKLLQSKASLALSADSVSVYLVTSSVVEVFNNFGTKQQFPNVLITWLLIK